MRIDKENGVILYTNEEYISSLNAKELRVYFQSIKRTLSSLFVDRLAFRKALSVARKIPNYSAVSLEMIYSNLLHVTEEITHYRYILSIIRSHAHARHIKLR